MLRLLEHRNARLYLAGQTLSLLGDTALFLAAGAWVKQLTGSSAAAGMVFLVFVTPSLGAPAAGLLVDRLRRRPLLLATNSAAALAVLPLFLVHGRSQVWLIYLVIGLNGVANVILTSAQSALLTVLVPAALLPDANGALQTIREVLRLTAPLVGAGLFAVAGGGAVAALDAASFAAAAGALCAVRVHEPPPTATRQNRRRELTAGMRHLLATPTLRRVVTTTAVAALVLGFSETLLFAVTDEGLHREPPFIGVLTAGQGAGAVLGGVAAAGLLRRVGDSRSVAVGLLLFAVGAALLVAPTLVVVLAGMAIAGAGVAILAVAYTTTVQTRTPLDLQGRAFSAADTAVAVPQTLSIASGALLSTVIDYRLLLSVMSAAVALCSLRLLRTRPEIPAGSEPAIALGLSES